MTLVGCADRDYYHDHDRGIARPVSAIGPSYTTVPLMVESGAPAATVTVPGAAVTVDTSSDAGRATAGARGDLLVAVDSILANWKQQPHDTARALIAKYGPPHEVTQSRLIWYNNGPWKRTELWNAEIPHNFPAPHNDMLLQVIDYRVPPEKAADLLAYNGSLLVDRTRGELGARCASEELNTMALNLAHDVITGQKTPELARESYTGAATQFSQGVSSPLNEKLQFITAVGPTADPDLPFRPAAERREPLP
jgi:hypothetical protein